VQLYSTCVKRSTGHTHTPTENNTPDTDTHAHGKNNTPNPHTNTSPNNVVLATFLALWAYCGGAMPERRAKEATALLDIFVTLVSSFAFLYS